MSCQKIRSMLSAYIDGEVRGDDAIIIKEHLAHCTSCMQEMSQVQHMSSMLGAILEIEPPAFLLEQIEAATINKPTFWRRLQAAFTTMPQYTRWGLASAAAVGVAIVLMFHPNGRYVERITQLAPKVIATQPMPKSTPKITITETPAATRNVGYKAHKVHNKALVAKAPAKHVATKSTKPVVRPETQVATNPEESASTKDAQETAATQSSEPVVAVKKDPIKERKPDANALQARLQQENDVMQDLRGKLADRNKQRKFETTTDRVEGNKHSVELVSIRF